MERTQTHPDLQSIIIDNLRAWYGDQPTTARDFDWPGVTDVNLRQNELGWEIFYDGFLIPDCAAIQQAYYEYLKKRNTGRRWASQLIRCFWTTAWDLWRHRIKILSTPDNASRIAHIALVDQQIQEWYGEKFAQAPRHGMNQWFSKPIDQLLGEPLNSKEQWMQIVDAALHYFA
jgi:hypothetical protein